MKMKYLSDDHYIVMDDSEIKEGDWYYLPRTHSVYQCKEDATELNLERDFGVSKVTHSTQPLDKSLFFTDRVWGCERLSIGEVKELLGEVDVEKKALEISPVELDEDEFDVNETHRVTWIDGYNQALEDNNHKKWTDADVIRIVEKSRQTGLTAEYLLLSLQPKTEWEVEIVDGKLKLIQ